MLRIERGVGTELDLISVIVPIYNVEKYLDRCVNSIVNQTYSNLEIILVDDGSPDNGPQMCDAWAKKDRRIKVVHKENAGLGMARNTGIEHASGAYICFFDSDDYVELDTIEKARRLAEMQKADIVVYGMSNVDRNGMVTRQLVPKPEKICFQGREVQERFLPDLIDSRHVDTKNNDLCLSACCCLFSMELIKNTGWRFVSERQNISEDSYSLIWLYKYVSKVAVLPEALYYYCDNETSLTKTYRADRFAQIKNFYLGTATMAAEQGYGDTVLVRIRGLFLAFTIAAMKQIVAANLSNKQKRALINEITADALTQQILADRRCRYSSRARKALFWAMRMKLYGVAWLLTWFQVRREENENTDFMKQKGSGDESKTGY